MIINTVSKKKRAIIYALCALMLLNIPSTFNGFEGPVEILKTILFLFFTIKSSHLFGSIKLEKLLKEADAKTEFLHEDKIYKIDNAQVIKKIEYPYHFTLDLARSVLGFSMKEAKLRTILYHSKNENYFIYTLSASLRVIIEPLSTEQAKKWLYYNDIELYKQIFSEFKEA